MKSIYDPHTRAEVIARINALTPGADPLWGKMNAYQMVRHCRLWEEMALGRTTYKRAFLGRIFGRMALAKFVADDRPLPKNSPTIPALRISDQGDIEREIVAWITMLKSYDDRPAPDIMHPFFGPISGEQVGCLSYKHADHHLRQFNS